MGSSSSKNRLFCESLNSFSNIEKDAIQKLFLSISDEKKVFTKTQFTTYIKGKVTADFSEKVFVTCLALKEGHKDGDMVNLVTFAKALAVLLRGSREETGQFLLNMMGPVKNCTNQILKQFLGNVSAQFISIVQKSPAYQSWSFQSSEDTNERTVKMIYFDLLNKRKNINELWESSEVVFTESELQQMFLSDSLLSKIFKSITSEMFPVLENRNGSLLPDCEESDGQESSALLDLPSVVLLNQNLPLHLRGSWRLLYSTHLHGQSFSMMLGRLIQKGPCIIVIKDKEGHSFGGFSSQSWDLRPTFTGKEDTFVFTLLPNAAVYSSTGYNSNYTYLCLHQHTLPNGLGFGGQLNNFGLWLDCEFEVGHSTPACSTFSSPQLSGSRQYKLDELQAWGVGPELQDPEKEVRKKSILDADFGAIAIMTLLNKISNGDGLRDDEDDDDREDRRVSFCERL